MKNVKVYDSGPDFLDRYTAVYLDFPGYKLNEFVAVGMSSNPFSPQGFGQHMECSPGTHLGTEIEFGNLPTDCKKLIEQDLKKD